MLKCILNFILFKILVANPQSNNKIDVYFCDKFFEIENTSKYNSQLKELIGTKTIVK
jgi:hypothetical protein